MDVYFEDSQSVEYSLLPKNLFYCFYNSTMKNDLPIESHWHYFVELLFVTHGCGEIIINGKSIVTEKGDFIVILPQDVHSIHSIPGKEFEYAVIKFDPLILFDSEHDAFLFKNITPITTPVKPPNKIYKKDSYNQRTEGQIISIMNTFRDKPYGFEFKIKSELLHIFYDFVNQLKRDNIDILGKTLNNDQFSTILPAFKYIQENFTRNISVRETAQFCNLSYSYFSRQFKKVSGISFSSYLNFIRVTDAERLLLQKTLSVTEIGYSVGFPDTSYFIKQFKIFKGITPKQFLKI